MCFVPRTSPTEKVLPLAHDGKSALRSHPALFPTLYEVASALRATPWTNSRTPHSARATRAPAMEDDGLCTHPEICFLCSGWDEIQGIHACQKGWDIYENAGSC